MAWLLGKVFDCSTNSALLDWEWWKEPLGKLGDRPSASLGDRCFPSYIFFNTAEISMGKFFERSREVSFRDECSVPERSRGAKISMGKFFERRREVSFRDECSVPERSRGAEISMGKFFERSRGAKISIGKFFERSRGVFL
jgi:hypothetical protein